MNYFLVTRVKLELANSYINKDFKSPNLIISLFKLKSDKDECIGSNSLINFDKCFEKILELPKINDSKYLRKNQEQQTVKRQIKLLLSSDINFKENNTNNNFLWKIQLDENDPNSENWNRLNNFYSFIYDKDTKIFKLTSSLSIKNQLVNISNQEEKNIYLEAYKYIDDISNMTYLPSEFDIRNNSNNNLFLKRILDLQKNQLLNLIDRYLKDYTYSIYKNNVGIWASWNELVNLHKEIKEQSTNWDLSRLQIKLKNIYNKFINLQNQISFIPLNNFISTSIDTLDFAILTNNRKYAVPNGWVLPQWEKFYINSWNTNVFDKSKSDYIKNFVYNTQGEDGVFRKRLISIQNILTWNKWTYYYKGDKTLSNSDISKVKDYYTRLINEYQTLRNEFHPKFLSHSLSKEEIYEYANKIKIFFHRWANSWTIPNLSDPHGKYAPPTLVHYIGSVDEDLPTFNSERPLLAYRFFNDDIYLNDMREVLRSVRQNKIPYLGFNSNSPLYAFSKEDFINLIKEKLEKFKNSNDKSLKNSKKFSVEFILIAINAYFLNEFINFKKTIPYLTEELEKQRRLYKNNLQTFIHLWARASSQERVNKLNENEAKYLLKQINDSNLIDQLELNIEKAKEILKNINQTADDINNQISVQKNISNLNINNKNIENNIYDSPKLFELLLYENYENELRNTNSLDWSNLKSRIQILKDEWIQKISEFSSFFNSPNTENTVESLANNGISRKSKNTNNIDWIYYAVNKNTNTDSYRNNLISSWTEMKNTLIETKKRLENRLTNNLKIETKNKLDKLNYLDSEVKKYFKNKIDKESDFSNVNEILLEAQEYNDLTKSNIIPAFKENQEVLKHTIYLKAKSSEKSNFSHILEQVANLLNIQNLNIEQNNDLKLHLVSKQLTSLNEIINYLNQLKANKNQLNGYQIERVTFDGNRKEIKASKAPLNKFIFTFSKNENSVIENYSKWQARAKKIIEINDKNGENGSLKIEYEVFNPNTNQWFEGGVWNETFTGFQTEFLRLKNLYLKLIANNHADKTLLPKLSSFYKKFPTEINREEIIKILNDYFTQFNAKVVSVHEANKNNQNGEWYLNYNIESTLDSYEDVKYTDAVFAFKKDENNKLYSYVDEQERINDVSKKINNKNFLIDISIPNSSNYSLYSYFKLRNHELNKLKIRIDNYQAETLDQTILKPIDFNSNIFDYYYLRDLKLFIGFKLWDLQIENSLKNKLNQEEGKIRIPFVIFSANPEVIKNNLNINSISNENTVIELNHFKKESERLDEILENPNLLVVLENIWKDSDKNLNPSEITLENLSNRLEQVINSVFDSNTFEHNELDKDKKTFGHGAKIILNNYEGNDIDGSLRATFHLLSKYEGNEQITSNLTKTIIWRNFLTEEMRLNNLFNKYQDQIDNLFANKKSRLASSFTNLEVENLLNSIYNPNLAKIVNLQISYSDLSGKLTVTFNLQSSKNNLESIQSSEFRTFVINNFKQITNGLTVINEIKKNRIEKIQDLVYLSQAEKDYFNQKINELNYLNFVNEYSLIEKIEEFFSKANFTNQIKEKILHDIETLQNLNNYQKLDARKDIINSNYEYILNSNNQLTEQVFNTFRELDNTMKLVIELINQNQIFQNDSYYEKFDEISKKEHIFITNIMEKLIHGQLFDTKEIEKIKDFNVVNEPNLNSAQIFKLIAFFKNYLKEMFKKLINNIENFSFDEKSLFIHKLDKTKLFIEFLNFLEEIKDLDRNKEHEINLLNNNFKYIEENDLNILKTTLKLSNLDDKLNSQNLSVKDIKEIAEKLDITMQKIFKLNNEKNVSELTIRNIRKELNNFKIFIDKKDKNSTLISIKKVNLEILKANQFIQFFKSVSLSFENYKNSSVFNFSNKIFKTLLMSQKSSFEIFIKQLSENEKIIFSDEIKKFNYLNEKIDKYFSLITALLKHDFKEFNFSIYNLIKVEEKYELPLMNLIREIRFRDYFNSFDKNGKSKLSYSDLNIKVNSLPQVIISALNLRNHKNFLIHPSILFVITIITLGLMYILIRKRNKNNFKR
ncbi:hypothetical protein [Mycoplasmopsis columbina]|uniref:hypothetical protein n=1 Tax=Mycoplasmopsis columbina TaxID=114881 RepID=UPI0004A73A2D|nr:hypothetical protein [Mycoplasmopsis columbina]VEU76912.1 Uncharacterised protein [Mycoplasmopsis columbina]